MLIVVATLLYGYFVFAVVLLEVVVAILVVECVGVVVIFRWQHWLWGLRLPAEWLGDLLRLEPRQMQLFAAPA